ncbi:DNA polymerase III subunit beta [Saccharopolyspora rosea]|uniref:DNA polymerase III subunit beta n=1 Tax=Saccharopolyspora rosea TaxID=524884 RepID=UPI0021D86F79|nr:DNA polymerase III subunit beta [Saccharopolyspora rosea]
MRVRIEDRGWLAAAAGWAVRNLHTRAAEPIYGGLLLAASEGVLLVEGYDSNTATWFRMPAGTQESGTAVVSARLLAEITRLLPHHAVELATTDTELTLACGASRARLPLMPVEDYPPRPTAPRPAWWCDAGELAAAVGRVAVAASREVGAAALACVALELPGADGGPLRLYATDRANLAAARVAAEPVGDQAGESGRVLVSAVAVDTAARTLAAEPGRIGIGVSGRVLALQNDTRRIALSTVDLKGHDYEGVLSAASGQEFVVHRGELEGALKRLSLHKDAPKARIDCRANELRLAVCGQHGHSEEILAVDYTGEPVTVGMFTHRLATALGSLGTDLAHLTVPPQPNRPWLLRPVTDHGTPDDTYRHMVIPAQLFDQDQEAA